MRRPCDLSKYEIAIKREKEGRGGSIWAHENIRVGGEVHVSAPRNNLPLAHNGSRYILVAGGIGVTPMLSLARAVKSWGRDLTVHYCARSEAEAPLLAELQEICGSSLRCWFSNTGSRFDPAVIGPTSTIAILIFADPSGC